jgi:hypothetical protein
MATVASTKSGVSPEQVGQSNWFGEMSHVQWTLANGDDGAPVSFAEFSDRSIQFTGTFGAGGSIQLEGSNDLTSPTNWFVLTDYQGNNIVKTAAAFEGVEEPSVWVRPRVTAGDGTTALVAKLYCRRPRGRASI